MSYDYRLPAIGVEEEYQLVSPESGILSAQGSEVLSRARGITLSNIQHELHLEQIEMASPILHTSEEVRDCLVDTRKALAAAATSAGSALVAAATNPMPLPEHVLITPKDRYLGMERQYQMLARDLMIFGCHVHVDMPDRELGIQVMNHSRPWLPLMQALSANSPYWHGEDTGYASYRREMWNQWPMSGIPVAFQDLSEYQECIQDLLRSEAIDDVSKIYWDIRLPERVPTIEFRVFDMQTEVEDAVALTVITRALVMRCEQAVHQGQPVPHVRDELLRAAIWRAARYGLSQRLIDPVDCAPINAFQHVRQFLHFLEEPLRALGDLCLVQDYVARLETQGTPSERQRNTYSRSGNALIAVARMLIGKTLPVPS